MLRILLHLWADKIHKEHYRQPLASRDILKSLNIWKLYKESIESASTQDTNNESASDMELEKQTIPEESSSSTMKYVIKISRYTMYNIYNNNNGSKMYNNNIFKNYNCIT